MKKYFISLISLTLLLVIVSFTTLWIGTGLYQPALSIIPLYFLVITGLMHYGVVSSFYKDPRTFVKNFLAITVGSLFLHLIVLFLWMFTHIATAKIFVIGFSICYAVYLIFETLSLILIVRNKRKENEK